MLINATTVCTGNSWSDVNEPYLRGNWRESRPRRPFRVNRLRRWTGKCSRSQSGENERECRKANGEPEPGFDNGKAPRLLGALSCADCNGSEQLEGDILTQAWNFSWWCGIQALCLPENSGPNILKIRRIYYGGNFCSSRNSFASDCGAASDATFPLVDRKLRRRWYFVVDGIEAEQCCLKFCQFMNTAVHLNREVCHCRWWAQWCPAHECRRCTGANGFHRFNPSMTLGCGSKETHPFG